MTKPVGGSLPGNYVLLRVEAAEPHASYHGFREWDAGGHFKLSAPRGKVPPPPDYSTPEACMRRVAEAGTGYGTGRGYDQRNSNAAATWTAYRDTSFAKLYRAFRKSVDR